MRKIFAFFLSSVLLVGTLTVGASAAGNSNDGTEIPENVAHIIATYFIRDAQTMPDSQWTEESTIANTVTLYDKDGSVSAYSFEVETSGNDAGYVVVSAYSDVESKILEFSDTADPVYKNLVENTTDTIVYTGGLNYFKEIDLHSVVDINGNVIDRNLILTPLNDSRDDMYSTQVTLPANRSSEIDDPEKWAEDAYGGTFTATEWKNVFENYCQFRTMDSFSYVNGVQWSNGYYEFDRDCCSLSRVRWGSLQ